MVDFSPGLVTYPFLIVPNAKFHFWIAAGAIRQSFPYLFPPSLFPRLLCRFFLSLSLRIALFLKFPFLLILVFQTFSFFKTLVFYSTAFPDVLSRTTLQASSMLSPPPPTSLAELLPAPLFSLFAVNARVRGPCVSSRFSTPF